MTVQAPLPSFERRFAMADGIALVADAWGAPDRPPALLLHGGGQTRHSWKRTATTLARHGYHALAVDLRGHGDSGWSPDGDYEIDRFAADVRRLAAACTQPPVLIGASLGGIASLIAAGEAEQPIAAALVLVDITPRVDPAGVDRIRGFMAAHIEDGFATLEEAADAIRYRWHYDPAFVRGMSKQDDGQRQARLSAAARRLDVPVLLVRGGSSELVSEEIAREFVAQVPNASYVDVAGAAHMVAGDVNDPFTRAVVGFLDGIAQRPMPR